MKVFQGNLRSFTSSEAAEGLELSHSQTVRKGSLLREAGGSPSTF